MHIKISGILALIALSLTACSLLPANVGATATQTPDTAATITAVVDIIFAEATGTARALILSATPTQTASPTASVTPSPTATATPLPTSTSTSTATPLPPNFIPENAILIYLVQLDTGGPIGCGDSLVKLWSGQVRTGDLETDLTMALNALFRAGQYFGGLYNATYPSNLYVTGVLTDNGETHAYMDGNYVTPKDSCDASRYQSQVQATARQFKEIRRFVPWVRDKLLEDLLSVYSDSGSGN